MRFRLLALFLALFIPANSLVSREAKGKKGKFFFYSLHSANLFKQTVDVKWTATLKDKPALPQWLHLLESKYSALAYLIGTPVTPFNQMIVHVIAKRTDNFASEHQYVVVDLVEDARFARSTTQILNIHIRNYDAESLVTDTTGLINRLEQSINNAFKGKFVNAYIYNIQPAVAKDVEAMFGGKSGGCIVSIGSQKGFSPRVAGLVYNIRTAHVNCRRNSDIPLDKSFAPLFDINWCSTSLQNITQQQKFVAPVEEQARNVVQLLESPTPELPPAKVYGDTGLSFWHGVLVIPFVLAICIILLLALCYIFFGRREGQHWRDYKTPKPQLEEYVNVRAGQRHLRELSVQRQLLLMSDERDFSNAPSGIHSFLQPKFRGTTSHSGSARFSKSASRLNDDPGEEAVSVSRQTVAEAAKQCGSSLHLYRNPLETESEEESDSSAKPASR